MGRKWLPYQNSCNIFLFCSNKVLSITWLACLKHVCKQISILHEQYLEMKTPLLRRGSHVHRRLPKASHHLTSSSHTPPPTHSLTHSTRPMLEWTFLRLVEGPGWEQKWQASTAGTRGKQGGYSQCGPAHWTSLVSPLAYTGPSKMKHALHLSPAPALQVMWQNRQYKESAQTTDSWWGLESQHQDKSSWMTKEKNKVFFSWHLAEAKFNKFKY